MRSTSWFWLDYYRTAQAEEMRARARERRLRLQQDGAEGGRANGPPAPVSRGAPSAAAPGSGRSLGNSPSLAPAVRDPRTVVPAAGAAPSDGSASGGAVPAVLPSPDSPGLAWARAAMAKGVALQEVLRKAGDRLTWRDRQVLQGQPAPRQDVAA